MKSNKYGLDRKIVIFMTRGWIPCWIGQKAEFHKQEFLLILSPCAFIGILCKRKKKHGKITWTIQAVNTEHWQTELTGLFRYVWVMGQRRHLMCPYPALCRRDSSFYTYLELPSERQPRCVGKVLLDLHKSDTIWFTACNIWVVANVAGSFRKPLA